jgi:2-polyprenyl-6-methoxyphenol hydroxylase-like FAD-dependent oxidoreductase
MPRETRTPVLVVGAGPVGLALAGDLGWRGIPCVLIDREPAAARALPAKHVRPHFA